MHHRLAAVAASLLLAVGAAAAEGPVVATDNVEARLVAEANAVAPGATILVGLHKIIRPGWHTYWLNPGDSGLPTKLSWTLPPGVNVSEIEWPAPHRIEIGTLVNYGYSDELLLPVQLRLPADLPAGSNVPVTVKASWLICQEECIPGDATFTLQIPTGEQSTPDPRFASLFVANEAHAATQTTWNAHWSDSGDQIDLIVVGTHGRGVWAIDVSKIGGQ